MSGRPLGEKLLEHRVVADAVAGPWLVSLVAQAEATCQWHVASGCIESRSCECAMHASIRHAEPTLVVSRVPLSSQVYRLPLTELPLGRLAVTPLAGGRFFATITYSREQDGARHTVLRYLQFRLPEVP